MAKLTLSQIESRASLNLGPHRRFNVALDLFWHWIESGPEVNLALD